MKTVRTITAVVGMAITATTVSAQLATLPDDSATGDGIPVQAEGANSGSAHWDASGGIKSYNVASNGYVPVPGSPDAVTGLTWGSSTPTKFQNDLATLNLTGGTIRGIFVGESAGWLNDFGYTYDKSPVTDPTNSFTVFSNIQTVGTPNVAFGDHVDVPLFPSEASTFDFWLNASGRFDNVKQSGTQYGGLYNAFDQTSSEPFLGDGNVMWGQSPIMVNTWVASAGQYEDVATYLASFEDWRLDRGSDQDFSDFIFGVQLFGENGVPLGGPLITPVPEPSTYGLIGAAALLGLVFYRTKKYAHNP